MIIKKQDWHDWLDGMRSKAMKAGAEAITTQLGAWFTTNAVATLPIESLHGVGLNYKTAIVALVIQFMVRVIYAAALYVQQKPDPDVITETVETVHVTRDEVTGAIQSGSSKTVTTTPVPPAQPKV